MTIVGSDIEAGANGQRESRAALLAELRKNRTALSALIQRSNQIADELLAAGSSADNEVHHLKIVPMATAVEAPPSFREAVIRVLRQSEGKRLKASEVGRLAMLLTGTEVFWKTPQMTLSRLLKEGIVGRDRMRWFYIEEDARRAAD